MVKFGENMEKVVKKLKKWGKKLNKLKYNKKVEKVFKSQKVLKKS